MILDSHMHVGEFPMFGVAMSRDGLVAEMREHGVATGLVFHPDNGLVRGIIGETPGVYGLVWANPRREGAAEDARRLIDEQGMPALSTAATPIFSLPWSIEGLTGRFADAPTSLGIWATATSSTSTRPSKWPHASPTSTWHPQGCRCTRRSARRSSASGPTES
jgi:hypothetical protein